MSCTARERRKYLEFTYLPSVLDYIYKGIPEHRIQIAAAGHQFLGGGIYVDLLHIVLLR